MVPSPAAAGVARPASLCGPCHRKFVLSSPAFQMLMRQYTFFFSFFTGTKGLGVGGGSQHFGGVNWFRSINVKTSQVKFGKEAQNSALGKDSVNAQRQKVEVIGRQKSVWGFRRSQLKYNSQRTCYCK